MPRRIMRAFKLSEISAVDRPAQALARAVIMKRDDHLPPEVEAYLKRTFTAEERKDDAKNGAALPDGSFPIENASDLHNAMQAIGRAKDPAKAKVHIRARAKALGLTAELSAAFKNDDSPVGKIVSFFIDGQLRKAAAALSASVHSIIGDDAATNKAALVDQTLDQFADHVTALAGDVSKAMAAGDAVPSSETENEMFAAIKKALGLADSATEAEVYAVIAKLAAAENKDKSAAVKKALGLAEGATETEVLVAVVKVASTENKEKDGEIAKLKTDLAIAKAGMSDDEKAYHDGLKDDGEKAAFRSASKEDRATRMKKRDDLPPDVRKALAKAEENEKRLAKLEDEQALGGFTKQAKEAGLPEADGTTLQKAYRGDKESVDKLVGYIKAANAAAKAAGLFKELGDGRSGGELKAYDELVAKADELRKKETGLTKEQAFAKVYADPANADLVKRERIESRPAAAA